MLSQIRKTCKKNKEYFINNQDKREKFIRNAGRKERSSKSIGSRRSVSGIEKKPEKRLRG